MRRLLPLLALCLLPACTRLQPETVEERDARLSADCRAAGFGEGTDAFRLCLLLQATNERLAYVERRLSFIEQDVRTPVYPYPYRWP